MSNKVFIRTSFSLLCNSYFEFYRNYWLLIKFSTNYQIIEACNLLIFFLKIHNSNKLSYLRTYSIEIKSFSLALTDIRWHPLSTYAKKSISRPFPTCVCTHWNNISAYAFEKHFHNSLPHPMRTYLMDAA